MDAILITTNKTLDDQICSWARASDVALRPVHDFLAATTLNAKQGCNLLIIDVRGCRDLPEINEVRQHLTNHDQLFILFISDAPEPDYWLHAHERDHFLVLPAPQRKLFSRLNSIMTNCQVMKELQSQVLLMETLFERSRDGIIISDAEGKLLITNKQLNSLLGYAPNELNGKSVSELLPAPYNQHFKEYLARFSDSPTNQQSSHKLVEDAMGLHKEGKIIPVELSISELPASELNQQQPRYLAVIRDIRERAQANRSEIKREQYDFLTSLPDRKNLQQRLDKQLAEWDKHPNTPAPAVMTLNISKLRKINESLGREGGDYLLKELTRRLRYELTEQDQLFHIAGGELAIQLRDGITENQIHILIGQLLDALQQPFMVDDAEVFASLFLGIARADQNTENGGHLIHNADLALNKAKQTGRNCWAVYSPDLPDANRVDHIRLESALFRAVEQEKLELHYQPQLDTKSSSIVGAEVLLRWNDPELGQVSPVEFVPILEDSGLITQVGIWVIENACRYWKFWQDEGVIDDTMKLSINVSPYQFRDATLLVAVRNALNETGLDPANLVLEVTESVLLDDNNNNLAILNTLKKQGIAIALDDFGTGFSSLSYLTQFPIDYLKIDRSFLTRIMDNKKDAALTLAIINMAHNLDMHVIAEGVDSWDKLNFLSQKQCDFYQGFYFSRPINGNEFIRLLNHVDTESAQIVG